MIETQAAHIRTAIDLAVREAGCIEIGSAAFAEYSRRMSRRLSRKNLWNSGCRSWYLDSAGRDTHNWPGSMSGYRRRARRARARDYVITPLPG